MIHFDFEYVKPSSAEEALQLFEQFTANGKKVMYYGGGTEFISRARMNEIMADVVIDLKAIPACNVLEENTEELVIGATKTLTDLVETNFFPLLSSVIRLIATRTERNKITIGGNLMSNLPYKEGILPFLLADSKLAIATKKGIKEEKITTVFEEDKIRLKEEEFIVQILTDKKVVNQAFFNEKKTKQSKVNYPILTLAALQMEENIKVAFSGLYEFPFHSKEIDKQVNDHKTSFDKRVEKVIKLLPASIIDDMHASSKYRQFVLKSSLVKMLENMEAVSS
ncbi:FAD binding domain-containing protein [Pseudogracilibacillus auburnensis]|uniref:FAD binding domain-containing protein n=1 Tax=Pseudogracilibacillus auburnensis TaxID=1494959 RepID=UPI001A95ECC3|nr:FAD binding domain-containing protein [Pseudogracilibacillus auburnensis]MBO1002370.1 FAD binding domain-containing protein [Pseudogracilibacillus auburnensis]